MKRICYLLVIVLALTVFGCGGDSRSDKDVATGPPSPDSPRAHQGAGVPLLLFGSGRNLRNFPGGADQEYQEYLLWREWQQYERYQKWLSQNQGEGTTGDEEQQ